MTGKLLEILAGVSGVKGSRSSRKTTSKEGLRQLKGSILWRTPARIMAENYNASPRMAQSPTHDIPSTRSHFRSRFQNRSAYGPSQELPSVQETFGGLAEQVDWLRTSVSDLQSRLKAAEDIQHIHQLLNHFAALHNAACANVGLRQTWEELFTMDGVAVYPFECHSGREGKGDWAFGTGAYFERSHLMLGNFDIKIYEDGIGSARVRSDYVVHLNRSDGVGVEYYGEGGFNHWVLKTDHYGKWAVKGVSFTPTWTMGQHPTYEEINEEDEQITPA